MKRFIVLVLVALVVTALPLVAACGEKEESTTTSAVSTTAGQSTTTTSGATTSEAQTTTTAGKPVTLYVGGTFALTGAYAEDCAAVLAGFKDYIAWVNDNHIVAPWHQDRTIPANIKFELLWADDALAPDKTLSIY